MFTGIVQEVGSIENLRRENGPLRLQVLAPRSAPELEVDRSVAINGTCLTVVGKRDSTFEVEVVEETLEKTTLGLLSTGDRVNLELPMRLSDRLDGHLVLGHVDARGEIIEIRQLPGSRMMTILIPPKFSKYCVHTGSIAVDGVSLTIAEVNGSSISVAIIPHTLNHTIFASHSISTKVNLEFDVLGKYVAQFVRGGEEQTGQAGIESFLSVKHLRELGF
ncbi:MAG TPA: riboflavin synthase [Bacteroidota bacterium]|nr:riboflavin synthase [Bacteroidota bacterium]